ncbi:alpha/beta hydrolase [Nocardia asteroides]|uniref:alpha/beta hydrolase n=1 Tax=Nocardia asteroides TaxID=1824 RepID=UPI001E4C50F8|nr:alpha/beta hydrolase [Nocardia asteroides]UGT63981.1 alpha/beta fold hydrolase [Nocardia asteroides]
MTGNSSTAGISGRNGRRWGARALLAVAALIPALAPNIAQAQPDPACRALSFAVPQGQLAATLCAPAAADTVVVLMAGSNYNHGYWDFGYRPETYNFRQALNRAGYATLIVDRLGNGASSKPPSGTLSATTSANALHDIVQAARRGLDGARPYAKVVTAGHSLSSGIAVLEAVRHHDVDGVLLTGYSHTLEVSQVMGVISSYHPAAGDPVFAGRSYDDGYLTTRPGTRAAAFYGPDTTDPAVLAEDERTKEVFSLTEYPDGLSSTLPPMSNDIDVPVMVVNGSVDRLSCGQGFAACTDTATLHASEAPYFAPAARLRAFVLPGSGHSVNLATNTVEYQSAVVDWLNTEVR